VHGDFSDITFTPQANYSTVFDLQGRVGLDADRNEQTAILLHQLRTAVADLIGPHAGPAARLGFAITAPNGNDFSIGAGRYYVDGIAVDNPADVRYAKQPYAFIDPDGADELPEGQFLVYLKVWERHVTEVEDPALHEPALGLHHPDSSSRAQVVWQVRAVPVDAVEDLAAWVDAWIAAAGSTARRGMLTVRTNRPDDADDDPCTATPDAGYTGENQLYRVEIRHGGTAREGASFVWSRDNGSVIYPIVAADGPVLRLDTLGRDWHTTLEIGQWVEAVDDAVSLAGGLGQVGAAPPLCQVTDLDVDTGSVTLDAAPAGGVGTRPARHPYLRRWDHNPPARSTEGAIPLREGIYLPLERGIEVRFAPGEKGAPHHYRSGDYWVFPARRTLGDVVWRYPQGSGPHGIAYRYAPLAVAQGDGVTGFRRSFAVPLTENL
jgi:hypothetical protein